MKVDNVNLISVDAILNEKFGKVGTPQRGVFRKYGNDEYALKIEAAKNGQVSIQVEYEDGSFWQKRMAELF